MKRNSYPSVTHPITSIGQEYVSPSFRALILSNVSTFSLESWLKGLELLLRPRYLNNKKLNFKGRGILLDITSSLGPISRGFTDCLTEKKDKFETKLLVKKSLRDSLGRRVSE